LADSWAAHVATIEFQHFTFQQRPHKLLRPLKLQAPAKATNMFEENIPEAETYVINCLLDNVNTI
jgi:hypothetical protein